MDPYANMGCVLKVNANCEACKMKVLEVVGSICGTYNITIDGERGLADITGQVDPNMVLSALAKSGQHAELVRIKLQHPASRPAFASRHAMMGDYNNPYYYYGHDGLAMNDIYGMASPYGTHHQPYPIHDPYWYERKPLQPTPFPSTRYPYYTSTSSFAFDHHLPPLIRNGCCHHRRAY